MSVRVKVHDDRIILDLERTSAHIEFPLYRGSGDPLITDFSPGLPVHVEQDTNAKVVLFDGWLIVDRTPLMPIGSQGSLGDGVTIARSRTDSRERDADVFPHGAAGADVRDSRETRQTIGGYRP